MSRLDAIAAMMAGKRIYNTTRSPSGNTTHSIPDPMAVDPTAVDWDQILGREGDDYRECPPLTNL
jgi:hypothetical protein